MLVALELASEEAGVWIGSIVAGIVLCGVLSMLYGDRFYDIFRRWWWWSS